LHAYLVGNDANGGFPAFFGALRGLGGTSQIPAMFSALPISC
jgi:hypothetical protein